MKTSDPVSKQSLTTLPIRRNYLRSWGCWEKQERNLLVTRQINIVVQKTTTLNIVVQKTTRFSTPPLSAEMVDQMLAEPTWIWLVGWACSLTKFLGTKTLSNQIFTGPFPFMLLQVHSKLQKMWIFRQLIWYSTG